MLIEWEQMHLHNVIHRYGENISFIIFLYYINLLLKMINYLNW